MRPHESASAKPASKEPYANLFMTVPPRWTYARATKVESSLHATTRARPPVGPRGAPTDAGGLGQRAIPWTTSRFDALCINWECARAGDEAGTSSLTHCERKT